MLHGTTFKKVELFFVQSKLHPYTKTEALVKDTRNENILNIRMLHRNVKEVHHPAGELEGHWEGVQEESQPHEEQLFCNKTMLKM